MFGEIRNAAKEGKAVTALCAMTGLNRAGYYRFGLPRQGIPVEMELRDEMQKIALECQPTAIAVSLPSCGGATSILITSESINYGAGDGDRTRDVQLGKLAFYR